MNARYTELRGRATKSGADVVASSRMARRTIPLLAILAGISLVAVACATAVDGTPTKRIPREAPIDLEPPDPPTLEAGVVDDDSGVFAPSRPREAGAPTDASVVDAGIAPNCPNYLAGSLRVDELMIASRDGSGDKGEWVELRNYASCTVLLDGLVVRSPRGTGLVQASLTGISLAPGESVLIANTLVPVDNHFLPGRVRAFVATTAPASDAGAAATADALKNATATRSRSYGWGDRTSFSSDSATRNSPIFRARFHSHFRMIARSRRASTSRDGRQARAPGRSAFPALRTLRTTT